MPKKSASKRSFEDFGRDEDATNQIGHFGIAKVAAALKRSAERKQIESAEDETEKDEVEWTKVTHKKKKRKRSNKESRAYPQISFSPQARLEKQVTLANLQEFLLYLLSDGNAPQWVAIQGKKSIQRAVVLLVPGLDRGLFSKSSERSTDSNEASTVPKNQPRTLVSPDDYYPQDLESDELHESVQPLADVFSQLWPIKSYGDERTARLSSPLAGILTVSSSQKNQTSGSRQIDSKLQNSKNDKGQKVEPVHISALVATEEQLKEHQYVLHPASEGSEVARERLKAGRQRSKQSEEYGWRDSRVPCLSGSSNTQEVLGGNVKLKIWAIDCEMCITDPDVYELTRISVIAADGTIILDELVKPSRPITNYLTPFSGMTKEKLAPVTMTLSDIQDRLLSLITPLTVIVGHSLRSDLSALKMTHPYVIDTAILFPHPRGPPFKSSLKWLAQRYLNRSIQTGSSGHDSVEDARAALDLVLLKAKKGVAFGTPQANNESIFNLLRDKPRQGTSSFASAVVDWGYPKRGYGKSADVTIPCKCDDDVVEGITAAIRGDEANEDIPTKGVNLVWARMRELEALRGWWKYSTTEDNDELRRGVFQRYAHLKINLDTGENVGAPDDNSLATEGADTGLSGPALDAVVLSTCKKIKAIYESLPPCTALMVYSGTGDPRALGRYQELHRKHKQEFSTRSWDELTVHWTDVEEQAMRQALRTAQQGLGFVTVK